MGIFTRVRDIINANINSMLDRAEDPEKLVKLMIREMEDTLIEIKANCAAAMATQKRIAREATSMRETAQAWGEKAELAVNKGREDLAREALLEKRRYAERAEGLEEELLQAQDLVTQYQDEIIQLEDKLGSAREKQRILVQRHRYAQNKKRAQSDMRRFDNADSLARFEQFEQRIDRMEAEADLTNFGRTRSLNEAFDTLVRDDGIEQELAALKARKSGNNTLDA